MRKVIKISCSKKAVIRIEKRNGIKHEGIRCKEYSVIVTANKKIKSDKSQNWIYAILNNFHAYDFGIKCAEGGGAKKIEYANIPSKKEAKFLYKMICRYIRHYSPPRLPKPFNNKMYR